MDSHCYQAGRNTTIDQEKYTIHNIYWEKYSQVQVQATNSLICRPAEPLLPCASCQLTASVFRLSGSRLYFRHFRISSIKCVKTFLRILVNRLSGTRTMQNCSQRQLFLEASRLKLEFWKLEMCLSSRLPIFFNKQQLSTKFEYIIKLKMTTRFWLSSLNMNS